MRSQSITALGTHHGAVMRRTDFYVAPNDPNASDAGPGTQATPFRTLNGLLNRLNQLVVVDANAAVVCHLANGTYTWSVTLGPVQLKGPIAIVGDGAGQPGEDGFTELQPSKAAAAGTGQRVVVDPDGGIAVNSLQGKTIEILSGNAAGDRRTIRNNTATDIVPQIKFSAAVAQGDAFRIVEPAVDVAFGAQGFGPGTPLHIVGVGSPGSSSPSFQPQIDTQPSRSSLLLANLRLVDTAGANIFQIQSSMVYCAGVQMDQDAHFFSADNYSAVWSGYDVEGGGAGTAFQLPFDLGLCADDDDWQGWGLSLLNGALPYIRQLRGCLVLTSANVTTVGIYESHWKLRAGAFRDDAFNLSRGGFAARSGTLLLFETLDTQLPFLIQAQGVAGCPAIRAGEYSYVGLENVTIEVTSVAGVGVIAGIIHLHGSPGGGGGTVFLGENVSISAPDVAAGATVGGVLRYHDAPALPVAPTAEIATWVGDPSGAAAATGTFAGLVAGGALLATAGDGTVVMRVP